jgi:hypothetical protein
MIIREMSGLFNEKASYLMKKEKTNRSFPNRAICCFRTSFALLDKINVTVFFASYLTKFQIFKI